MKPQKIFDRVATHLLTQKKKSQRGGSCLYRGPKGLKCAIGCLIPDNKYDPEMENAAVEGLFLSYPAISKLLGEYNENLLVELQDIHDYRRAGMWKNCLAKLAENHELSPVVLEKF